MKKTITTTCLIGSIAIGCNVDDNNQTTGGVNFNENGGAGGTTTEAGSGGVDIENNAGANSGGSAGVAGESSTAVCERGLVIVMSDYESTNVAISSLDGTTKSGSFISSAATKPGLSLALSGDIEVPRLAPSSGHVVLLDRFGTNVVTWVDLESAKVLGQLPVGTGFESNPQDYVEYAKGRAVLSRLGTNPNPGKQDYDAGGDLLVLDTETPQVLRRIAMVEEDETLQPRPSGMTLVEDTVVVTLGRLSDDFTKAGNGRFVGISPENTANPVLWTVNIEGLKNCGRLAKSPSGKLGAIACSSLFDMTTYQYNPAESDVVIFDLTATPPKELRRLGLGKAVEAGMMANVEFASESKLFALAYGGNVVAGDRVFAVDVETGDFEQLLEADGAYKFFGTHCAPGCGDVCVLSDAETGVLKRFSVSDAGEFTALDDVKVESSIGLPPHGIGAL